MYKPPMRGVEFLKFCNGGSARKSYRAMPVCPYPIVERILRISYLLTREKIKINDIRLQTIPNI